MTKNETGNQDKGKVGGLIYFYFNVLLVLLGLFLIGGNIYGAVAHGNSAGGGGLFAGIVITIYSVIAIVKYSPYKSSNKGKTD